MNSVFRNSILIFLGALVAAAIAAYVFIPPAPPKGYGAMTDPERAAELAKDGKRLQIVTFMNGLIPLPPPATAADPEPEVTQYAIVSGQITLGVPEPVSVSYNDSSFRGFKRYPGAMGAASLGSSSAGASGRFNNVLIYDKKTGAAKKIFDTRITITEFRLLNGPTKRVLAFLGTSDDTNRDGRLDEDDLQKLFVYTMADGQLHPVTGLTASPTRLIEVDGVDYLVLESAIDTNKDGEVRDDDEGIVPEPRILYRVDLNTFTAKPLLDPALVNDVQATLDGVKPGPATATP